MLCSVSYLLITVALILQHASATSDLSWAPMIPATSNMDSERQQHRDGDSGDLWQSGPLQQLDDRR